MGSGCSRPSAWHWRRRRLRTPRALQAAQPRRRRPRRGRAADPSLVNAWGLAFGPTTPAWVADNGTDVSTLYSGAVGATPVAKVPLTVWIPGGAPTGAVFNGSTGFVVHSGTSSRAGAVPVLLRGGDDHAAGTRTSRRRRRSTQAQTAVDGPGRDLQGPRDRRHGDRPAALRDRLPQRHGRRVGRKLRPGAAARARSAIAAMPKRLRAVRHPGGRRRASSSPTPSRTRTPRTTSPGPATGFVDVYDTDGNLLRRFAAARRAERAVGHRAGPAGVRPRRAARC